MIDTLTSSGVGREQRCIRSGCRSGHLLTTGNSDGSIRGDLGITVFCISTIRQRTLQLDDVALGVREVHGGSLSLGAIARLDRTRRDSVTVELPADRCLVERLDPEAEMVEVPSGGDRRTTARTTELAVDRDKVEERPSDTQLHETDLLFAAFDRATECVAIEADHAFDVHDAKHEVIDIENPEHGRSGWHRKNKPAFHAVLATLDCIGRGEINELFGLPPA